MWLVDVTKVWDELGHESTKSTDLALRLLSRTQELLGDGRYWRAEAMAFTRDGSPCDPLSLPACYFSLAGAAARARWEMRDELAAAEISPRPMQEVMQALFTVAREYRKDQGGWPFAKAVLDGLAEALEQYRHSLASEDQDGRA